MTKSKVDSFKLKAVEFKNEKFKKLKVNYNILVKLYIFQQLVFGGEGAFESLMNVLTILPGLCGNIISGINKN